MNMNFMNQQEGRTENQAEQFNENFMQGNDQEFSLQEGKKPLNRNMVVLMVIAAVGAALIYVMYIRGGFRTNAPVDPAIAEIDAKVSNLLGQDGASKLRDVEKGLAQTETYVKLFQTDATTTQIPSEQLRVNPFAFDSAKEPEAVKAVIETTQITDPAYEAKVAAAKLKLTMIFSAGANSTCSFEKQHKRVGDEIVSEGVTFKVRDIQSDRVVLYHPVAKNIEIMAATTQLR